MNENNNERDSKTVFRFRFSPLILAVLILGLVLCAVCIAFNSWQLALFLQDEASPTTWDWLKFSIFYFVAAFFAVLVISMLIRSRYILTDKDLILQFGIVKSRYEIKKIFSLRLFEKSNKLTVYFDDFKTKYMIIVVHEQWYKDFVEALQQRNDRIEFELVCPTDKPDKTDEKKKK